ncbi:hypothetical protein ASPSYDRAFT_95648 [Aspergillus sydowii CBS 593.65]|uniref:Uncharacterized protein n=1 Tax=Aspergillus sydowii CBS 593.65 TaxID=1036612 RepID=A0A1L9SZH6_9EURO|nr:uncharacterized protein ASPSYDRAFT_95648 [Aspergillus sydowii CBS 593.65]OJJ52557.1 hypothetical protein ASPSYDRAFT_95648 [Aspergillus sydowii CBS 593.65]
MKAALFVLASLCSGSALGRALHSDKAILLLHDGTSRTIDKKDLGAHLPGVSLSPAASSLPKFIETRNDDSGPSSHLSKRDGAQFIIPLPDEEFLGWDIAMSTIVHANEAEATVAMAQGQTVANSITVGTSFQATIEKFLQVGYSIDVSYTETATLTGTVTMTIPKNRWGAIISNPLTLRKKGYVFNGQPGNGQYEYYQGDSFTHDTYSYGQNSLSWVKGVVTTCLGDSYPLKRCVGDGELK